MDPALVRAVACGGLGREYHSQRDQRRSEGPEEDFDDIRYYHRKGPEFLALNQLHALTHLVQFYYGATWNTSAKALFNWRDEAAGNFEALCKSFVQPERVLKVIQG